MVLKPGPTFLGPPGGPRNFLLCSSADDTRQPDLRLKAIEPKPWFCPVSPVAWAVISALSSQLTLPKQANSSPGEPTGIPASAGSPSVSPERDPHDRFGSSPFLKVYEI